MSDTVSPKLFSIVNINVISLAIRRALKRVWVRRRLQGDCQTDEQSGFVMSLQEWLSSFGWTPIFWQPQHSQSWRTAPDQSPQNTFFTNGSSPI
jgi:hypothetical protein